VETSSSHPAPPTPALAEEVAPRRRPVVVLLALLLTLLACMPTLLIDLGGRDTTHTMENVTVVVAQETWLRWHTGDRSVWLVPSHDWKPRLKKPPMVTWMHFLAWADLDPSEAEPDLLLYRARLLAVAMGLILLASVFWIGHTLGDLRLAVIATLVAGSTFFFQRQARTSSYDIHFVAWATLSIASALWAMNPRGGEVSRARLILGWLIAGLAMAASTMSKNPLAVAMVGLPVGGTIVLLTGRRKAAIFGLLAAVAITALIVTPWYIYVARTYATAEEKLMREFTQPRGEDAQEFYYYICIFALVMPWTLWLISGLIHPFMGAARGRRRRLLVAWLWFVLICVFFSIPAAKQQRYILPALPAAALLIAQVWRDHDVLAQHGRRDRSAGGLIRAHWIMLLVASILIGLFFALQEPIIEAVADWHRQTAARLQAEGRTTGPLWEWVSGDDYPTKPVIEPVPWMWAGLSTLVLAGLAVAGLRVHLRGRPMHAAIIGAVWGLFLFGVIWHYYALAPSAVHPIRAPARELAHRVGDAPLRSLRVTDHDKYRQMLNEEFRFYYGRLIPHVWPENTDDCPESLDHYLARPDEVVYVLAKDGSKYERIMLAAGLTDEGPVQIDTDRFYRLWARRR
jgi:4-amino-4-deoxy-L-arabinose transferase-like glycosyltransferase